jgi:hypothetical protein
MGIKAILLDFHRKTLMNILFSCFGYPTVPDANCNIAKQMEMEQIQRDHFPKMAK